MTQVSSGQVTAPQTAAPALETLPAGAQLRGQVVSGAPEGMMRLAVGSARLDVKADLPLPAGTPVLIEVEQPAPAMQLKVSADEAALQGRGPAQASAGQAAGQVTGQATSEAILQAQQFKSAAALAQAAGAAKPAQTGPQAGGAQARPVLANVDLSTFVLLKADTNAAAAAAAQRSNGSPSGSPGSGSQASGSQVSGVAASGIAAASGAPVGGQATAAVPAGAQGAVQAAPQTAGQPGTAAVPDAAGRIPPPAPAPSGTAPPLGPAPGGPVPGQIAAGGVAAPAAMVPPAQVPAAATDPVLSGSAGQTQNVGQLAGQGASQGASQAEAQSLGQPQSGQQLSSPQLSGSQLSGQPQAPSLPVTPASAAGGSASTGAGAEAEASAKPAIQTAAGQPAAGAAVSATAGTSAQAATAPASVLAAAPQLAPGLGQSAPANAGILASNAVPNALPGQGSGATSFSAGSNTPISVPMPSAASSAGTGSRPSLSGAQTEAEFQALARGAGPLTAAGEAARALDPQALKAALAEPAQARSVLSALMASAGKLDTAALPPAGQRLVEALKGLQADADSLSDPARLKAAVEAVLGLAASAGGPMASSLSRKTGGVQKTDGLTQLLVRLAGLADDVLAAQPLPPSGRKAGAQARSGAMPSHLDPETATTLAQKTGAEVGERVRLQSVSRMAAEYLIRDMAQNAGNGAGQEAQAGHGRSAASASAGTAASGTPSGTPAASRPVDVSLDLPVLIDGQSRVLSLRISRDPQKPDTQPDPKGPEWRVRFSLDLPEGGPVEAAAGLRGISSYVTLRAVEEETLAGFLSRRDTLAALFADEGLELEDLRILKAKPEAAVAVPQAPLDRSS
ncbi:hypothetical protein V6L76_00305 [Pannonibacter sp. Pt2]|uniref:Flagellar hook-length control protein FliK n=1 Tax=Pannonibacter anstelovis TaxID=3121537 RepID=A0ABU7ZHE3_9HYPH